MMEKKEINTDDEEYDEITGEAKRRILMKNILHHF